MLIRGGEIRPQILYSCYVARTREGEQFVPEHVFSYQLAGSLTIMDADKTYQSKEGDFRFTKRNELVKFIKEPPVNGDFKAISIYLDQDMLRDLSKEYGYEAVHKHEGSALQELPADRLYKSYMESLLPYHELGMAMNKDILSLKVREAALLLLQVNPELKDVLFDFSEPGKIDLEEFMVKNYHFNVALSRFAYLTGRSLATFKRDFDKIFHETPSRWLQQRRLQEAYYQIKEKGKMPSDVYLELGFEDLSHFSFVFKKMYGVSPSKV